MSTDRRFPDLVALACHDLRTPLATVAGFAGTLLRMGVLDDQTGRYVSLIDAAAHQMADIIDELSVVTRIESGRFEPALEPHDSLEIARDAAARLGEDKARASGVGVAVAVDRGVATRAIAGIARAALRHGGLESIELLVDGATISVEPLVASASAVALGEDPRDLGAATGRAALEAMGASLSADGERLVVRLPA